MKKVRRHNKKKVKWVCLLSSECKDSNSCTSTVMCTPCTKNDKTDMKHRQIKWVENSLSRITYPQWSEQGESDISPTISKC